MSQSPARAPIDAIAAFWRRQPARRQRRRTAVALVAAPVATSLLATVGLTVVDAFFGSSSTVDAIFWFWVILSIGLMALSATVGWVFHAIAFRFRWRSWPTYLIAGAAIGGAIPLAPFAILATFADSGLNTSITPFIVTLGVCALLGAVTSSLFWLLRRPDRDIDTDAALVFE